MNRVLLLACAAYLPALFSPPAVAQRQDYSPRAMLLLARGALDRGRLVEGREALERAETRLLNGFVELRSEDLRASIVEVKAARSALERRDRPGTRVGIERALARLDEPAASLPPVALAPAPRATESDLAPVAASPAEDQPPAPPPVVTYALRAGRWELRDARHVWMPPDTVLQRVQAGRPAPNRWVWRGGEYRWQLLPGDAP
jgi:hypothetical protein